MSRTNGVGKPESARETLRHAVAHARPLATKVAASARHGSRRSRAWAAPQVQRTGQFLEQVAAPKVSAVLSSAARKIEPAEPPHHRWGRRAGVGGFIAVVAGAVTAFLSRRKPAAEETVDETGSHAADPAGDGRVEQPVTGAEATRLDETR
jgi:hypothetical protein